MTIDIPAGGLTRCSGGGHFFLQVSVNAGSMRTFTFGKDDLNRDVDDPADERGVLLSRLVTALRESGATTFAQIKAGLEGKRFKV